MLLILLIIIDQKILLAFWRWKLECFFEYCFYIIDYQIFFFIEKSFYIFVITEAYRDDSQSKTRTHNIAGFENMQTAFTLCRKF